MDAGMDTGDLLGQTEPLAIAAGETYGELHDRLAEIGAELLDEVLTADARGELQQFTQARRAAELGIGDEEIARSATRPLTKDDRFVALDACAQAIVDRIRSLAPVPGALLPYGDVQLKILRAHAAAEPPAEAPSWQATDGWVVADEVVPPGKSAMNAAAFVRGLRR